MLVISPRYIDEVPKLPELPDPQARMPGPAFLVGKALNSLLLDRVENDIERLQRINELLLAGQRRYGPEFVPEINRAMGHKDPERGLRPLRALLVRSSQNMGKMAAEYVRSKQFGQRASGMVSRLLHKVADQNDNEADLLSYVLFDGEFAAQLIELGRKDARAQHQELCDFFTQDELK